MYSNRGVVYELHAGLFVNRTPGHFINCGLLIKFKGLLCENPTEIDTEYDRAKVPPYNLSDPTSPLEV